MTHVKEIQARLVLKVLLKTIGFNEFVGHA